MTARARERHLDCAVGMSRPRRLGRGLHGATWPERVGLSLGPSTAGSSEGCPARMSIQQAAQSIVRRARTATCPFARIQRPADPRRRPRCPPRALSGRGPSVTALADRSPVRRPTAIDELGTPCVQRTAAGGVGVEAETAPTDVQALERRLALKERDGGAEHVVLLLLDTRRNRPRFVSPAMSFGVGSRGCPAALHGPRPGGSRPGAARSSCRPDVSLGSLLARRTRDSLPMWHQTRLADVASEPRHDRPCLVMARLMPRLLHLAVD